MVERHVLVANRPSHRKKWLLGALILFFVIASFWLVGSIVSHSTGKIALLRITGTISSSDGFLASSTSPDNIIASIERAESDFAIKGLLIEINSPGGSAVASEEIMKAVRDAGKPVVAVIRDVGASGAYWVASAADHVIASPVSLTGSVGVTGSYLEFSELFDKYGIGYERLVAGEYKDLATPFRNLSDAEREILESDLASMHRYFLNSVTENRGLEDAGRISSALIFLGADALELGLVDELGGRKEAENWLMNQTGLTSIEYVSYEKMSFLGTFFSQQSASAGAAFGNSFISALVSRSHFLT